MHIALDNMFFVRQSYRVGGVDLIVVPPLRAGPVQPFLWVRLYEADGKLGQRVGLAVDCRSWTGSGCPCCRSPSRTTRPSQLVGANRGLHRDLGGCLRSDMFVLHMAGTRMGAAVCLAYTHNVQ